MSRSSNTSNGSTGSGGSAGVFQTCVSCTRNNTSCIEDIEIAILCVQQKEGLFVGGNEDPAGTLGGAPSMEDPEETCKSMLPL